MTRYPPFEKLKSAVTQVLAVGILAILATLSLYFFNFHSGLSELNADWGTFGDFVGGTLNPIFAFLSFIALALTLLFQYLALLETRVEVEANNHRNSIADFLRRFEIEEENLEQLAIDITKNLLLHVQYPNQGKGNTEFDAMLSSYEKGEKNVFMNYLKSFFVVGDKPEQVAMIMNFADCSYGLQVEQYVKRFEGLLQEGRELSEKTYELLKYRTAAKLYDALKYRYDIELRKRVL